MMSNVFGHRSSAIRFKCVCVSVIVFVARIFHEISDIRDSHSCACTWSAVAILLSVMGSCLKVTASDGSSLKETSWVISDRVLTWKVCPRMPPAKDQTRVPLSTPQREISRVFTLMPILSGYIKRTGGRQLLLLILTNIATFNGPFPGRGVTQNHQEFTIMDLYRMQTIT